MICLHIIYICDSWGIYSPPLTSKHLNVEPTGGKQCSVFEFHGADVMIAVNFAAKAFDKRCSCDQDTTNFFWSHYFKKWPNTIDQTCIVFPQLSSGSMTLKSSSVNGDSREQCFPGPTCVLLVLLFHLRKKRLLLAEATFWRLNVEPAIGEVVLQDGMSGWKLWGFSKYRDTPKSSIACRIFHYKPWMVSPF